MMASAGVNTHLWTPMVTEEDDANEPGENESPLSQGQSDDALHGDGDVIQNARDRDAV